MWTVHWQSLYTRDQVQRCMPYTRVDFPKSINHAPIGWESIVEIPNVYRDVGTHWRISLGPLAGRGRTRLYRLEVVSGKVGV